MNIRIFIISYDFHLLSVLEALPVKSQASAAN